MRIRVIGGGWYGSHLSLALLRRGHDVELHEVTQKLFAGASGANPARLHLGFHYPRSRITRAACQDNNARFMQAYGRLTRVVPCNIYAIAEDSQVDYGSYIQMLGSEIDLIKIYHPEDFGLQHIEGAVLTGERHIVIAEARKFFEEALGERALFGMPAGEINSKEYDWNIDCTFCANDAENIDRYEPCVMGLLSGRTDTAVTIMDGPFPSIYPWNELEGLNSLTSAQFTPLAKCPTWAEAKAVIDQAEPGMLMRRVEQMWDQIEHFWPRARWSQNYEYAGYRTGIRAMPRSKADARLVDVIQVGDRALRIRAGKIDAILLAEDQVVELIAA